MTTASDEISSTPAPVKPFTAAGHTPGPWYSEEPTMGFGAIRAETGELIFGLAAGAEDERQSEEVCEANAHLIAAAPDMREALVLLCDFAEHASSQDYNEDRRGSSGWNCDSLAVSGERF